MNMSSVAEELRAKLIREFTHKGNTPEGTSKESSLRHSPTTGLTLVSKLLQYHLHLSSFEYSEAEEALRSAILALQQRDRNDVEEQVLQMAQVNLLGLKGSKRLMELLSPFPDQCAVRSDPSLYTLDLHDCHSDEGLYNEVLSSLINLGLLPWTRMEDSLLQPILSKLAKLEGSNELLTDVQLVARCYERNDSHGIHIRLLLIIGRFAEGLSSPAETLGRLAALDCSISKLLIEHKLQDPASQASTIGEWLQTSEVIRSNMSALVAAFPTAVLDASHHKGEGGALSVSIKSFHQHPIDPTVLTMWKVKSAKLACTVQLSLPQRLAQTNNEQLDSHHWRSDLRPCLSRCPRMLNDIISRFGSAEPGALHPPLKMQCLLRNLKRMKKEHLSAVSQTLPNHTVLHLILILFAVDDSTNARIRSRFLQHFPLPQFIFSSTRMAIREPSLATLVAISVRQLERLILCIPSSISGGVISRWCHQISQTFRNGMQEVELPSVWKDFIKKLIIQDGQALALIDDFSAHDAFLHELPRLSFQELSDYNERQAVQADSNLFMIDSEKIEADCDWRSLIDIRSQRIRNVKSSTRL